MSVKIAYTVMRLCLGVVFLIFGVGKFQHDYWARTIETMDFFQHFPWPAAVSVILIGATEVATGVLLIVGLFTRMAAALSALQLTGILILLNFSETRDIGLWGTALYLAISAGPSFGLDDYRSTHK